jgi:hypothetical protein
MQKIPSLFLPKIFPSDEAIKSFRDNRHGYEPEFWEFFYEINRYLEHVRIEELRERYFIIRKNLNCLSSEDRHIIPRQSFLSSWYWFLKEHQTRYEFYLRNEDIDCSLPVAPICKEYAHASIRPRSPNAGDVLYRYSKPEYIDSFLREGKIRIQAASQFVEFEGDKAREDDELNKYVLTPGGQIRVTTQDGKAIPVIGNAKRTVSAPNYYIFCTSCDWDPDLKVEFGGACAVIKNPTEFSIRLNRAANKIFDGWYFHHNPVEYYDPYDTDFNRWIDSSTCKDFRFAYQREYRFLWMHMEGVEAIGYIDLALGCLNDIAEQL